jgi:hypothetical protein
MVIASPTFCSRQSLVRLYFTQPYLQNKSRNVLQYCHSCTGSRSDVLSNFSIFSFFFPFLWEAYRDTQKGHDVVGRCLRITATCNIAWRRWLSGESPNLGFYSRHLVDAAAWDLFHASCSTSSLHEAKGIKQKSLMTCEWNSPRNYSQELNTSSVCCSSLSLWNPVVTSFNIKFCIWPHSVFMCSVLISEQTAIISLYSINCLVFTARYILNPYASVQLALVVIYLTRYVSSDNAAT